MLLLQVDYIYEAIFLNKCYTFINDRYIGKHFSQFICTFVSTKQTPSDAEYTDCVQDSAYNILIIKSLVNILLLQLAV